MAAFDRISSGISEMDTALDNIRLGDNVVWRVSDLSEFKLFMEPYIKQAIEDKRNIIYFRFASHEPLLEDRLEIKRIDVPLSHRFETFTVDIHNVIEKEGFQSNAVRRVGIKWLSGLIKLFSGGKRITDPTSGMRMVSRNLMKLYAEDYPIDYPEPESTMHALSKKFKVCEVPVKMKERMEGKSSISLKGGAYYMLKVSIAIIFASFKR